MNNNQQTITIASLIIYPLYDLYRKLWVLHSAIFVSVLLWGTPLISHPTIFVIVHGTWSSQEDWHMPGGDFFEALQHESLLHGSNASLVSFSWCGSNNHDARIRAANRLAGLIRSYPSDTVFHLVGHSHGGNVILLACKQLNKECPRIETVTTLGTPVSQYYTAPMHIINHLYHFYSFDDFVQPVLGFFERVFPRHEHIINIRVHINGNSPNHSELHNPDIARLIAKIVNIEWFYQDHHLIVLDYLSNNKIFTVQHDWEYDLLAERDVSIMKMFQNICRNQPECNSALSDIITPLLLFPLETYPKYH